MNMHVKTITLLCCSLACVFAGTTIAHANTIFKLGTGGSSGTYFPIGSLISQTLNLENLKTSADNETWITK